MNPYAILAGVILWLASLAGVGYWQHGAGDDARAKVDQVQFDKINVAIAENKAKANLIYQADLQTDRDSFKTQLEKEHAANQAATAALHDKYFGVRLHFSATEVAGSGDGSTSAVPSLADASRAAGTITVELSAAASSALRQLAYEADQLADNYRECYGFVQGMK